MKKSLIVIFFLSVTIHLHAQNKVDKEIKPYVDFLKKEKPASAKDYVISLFKDHDLVILCERDHREMTQYDLFLDILRDPYFVDNVGVVFTEAGARNLNPELNAFLQNSNFSEDQINRHILNFQRDCSFPIWEKTNFSYFLKGIHKINTSLPEGKKISMYPTDVLNIEGEPTNDKLKSMLLSAEIRDSLMSDFIIYNVAKMNNNKPGKALIIMNSRHTYRYPTYSNTGYKSNNMAQFLFSQYPGRVANVLINSYDNATNFAPVNDGKWDAAFVVMKTENAGFDFKGSPFGKDYFDSWPFKNDFTYEQMFNGYVYWLPIEKFDMAQGLPHLMDDGFFEEFTRRDSMYNNVMLNIIMKRNQPVPPADTARIMSLNQTRHSKLHTLNKVKESIEKWLK